LRSDDNRVSFFKWHAVFVAESVANAVFFPDADPDADSFTDFKQDSIAVSVTDSDVQPVADSVRVYVAVADAERIELPVTEPDAKPHAEPDADADP
jgi:hypothetical protein